MNKENRLIDDIANRSISMLNELGCLPNTFVVSKDIWDGLSNYTRDTIKSMGLNIIKVKNQYVKKLVYVTNIEKKIDYKKVEENRIREEKLNKVRNELKEYFLKDSFRNICKEFIEVADSNKLGLKDFSFNKYKGKKTND